MQKKCKICGEEKSESEFYSPISRRVCKKCKNKTTAPNSRNYTSRNKELVLRHYSPDLKCACLKCPFPFPGIDFLSLDHINGKGDHGREIRRRLYQWIKNNNFPKGFQVLCYNCNLAKRANKECPHTLPSAEPSTETNS